MAIMCRNKAKQRRLATLLNTGSMMCRVNASYGVPLHTVSLLFAQKVALKKSIVMRGHELSKDLD